MKVFNSNSNLQKVLKLSFGVAVLISVMGCGPMERGNDDTKVLDIQERNQENDDTADGGEQARSERDETKPESQAPTEGQDVQTEQREEQGADQPGAEVGQEENGGESPDTAEQQAEIDEADTEQSPLLADLTYDIMFMEINGREVATSFSASIRVLNADENYEILTIDQPREEVLPGNPEHDIFSSRADDATVQASLLRNDTAKLAMAYIVSRDETADALQASEDNYPAHYDNVALFDFTHTEGYEVDGVALKSQYTINDMEVIAISLNIALSTVVETVRQVILDAQEPTSAADVMNRALEILSAETEEVEADQDGSGPVSGDGDSGADRSDAGEYQNNK